MEKLKIIITGATGMIGEGVLYQCLHNENIEKILVVTRNSCGYKHPKLTEIIHNNFFDFTSIGNELKGYNTCFFCLGTTAIGKTEEEYTKLTYTLTLNFAKTLATFNPDMTFCYISGSGANSTEKGKIMWARVKGKTENDLMKLPFKKVYNFRPAGIKPFLPLKPSQTYYKTYKYLGWLFTVVGFIAPNYVVNLKDLANAMINSALTGYSKNILEVTDIKQLAKEAIK
jgi:hypothetical protein